MISCLIIDDEELARLRLRKLLESVTEISVLDEAENGLIAVEKINLHSPDLIFLDIQMPGLNGFEVLKHIKNTPTVIFTTAFDEFAIQAFEENAIGYLLKPIEKEKLYKAIEKARHLIQTKQPDLSKFLEHFEKKEVKHFISKLGSKIRFIPKEEVCYISSKDKHTFIHLKSGKEHIIDQTLTELENQIGENFIRIHRSVIVCTDMVLEAEKVGDGKYLFTINDTKHSQVQSSSGYANTIRSVFGF